MSREAVARVADLEELDQELGLEDSRPPEEPRPARGAWTEIADSTVIGAYLQETSQPIYSLLFLIPLLVAYELTAVVVNFDRTLQIRNAADIMIKNVLMSLGIRSMLGFVLAVVLIAIACALLALREAKGPIKGRYFLGMLFESALYASLLGTLSLRLTDLLMGVQTVGEVVTGPRSLVPFEASDLSQWMIALGAGVYEEIVFRVLLISVLLSAFHLLARSRRLAWLEGRWGAVLAAALAALLFSLFHYVGVHGEVFVWQTFLYRFVAGLFLALIYVARGLGVAAWTHALYDVSILLGVA